MKYEFTIILDQPDELTEDLAASRLASSWMRRR